MKAIFSRLMIFAVLWIAVPAVAQVDGGAAMEKKKGKVTLYYQNGKKEAAGKVKNYKKQGTWKYWDPEGFLEKTVQFKDGQASGVYTEFFHDGSVSVKGSYAGDRKTGAWTTFYQGGKKASELNYAGNEFDGRQQWWYENGQLREQSMYTSGKIVYRRTWYYNGRKKTIETYKDGLAEGTWRTYPSPTETRDTLPSSIDEYSGGKRNGLHIGYSYGKRTEEIYYKDDRLDGSYQKWDETGLLGISENYKNGERNGTCRYFDKGKLMREAQYANGRLDGTEKEYYFSTTMTKTSWYHSGVLDSAYTYFPNGKIETTRIYRYYPGFVRTEEFSFYTEYDSLGHKLIEGEFHFEARDRYWITYYPNGAVKSKTPYSSGKITGLYKKWYVNGKPLIEMECEGSNVVSQPKVWDEKGRPLKPGSPTYEAIVESSRPGEVYNDPSKYRTNRTSMSGSVRFAEPRITEEEVPPPQEMVMEIQAGDVTQEGEEDAPISPLNEEMSDVFQYAETMPEFPGGAAAFQQFLKENLVYPETAKGTGKQGVVYVTFIVEKDGSLSDLRVVKGVAGAPELDQEALRVIRLSPKWKPGEVNGKKVRVKYTQPVRFSMQ